jgi:hypothetical protein
MLILSSNKFHPVDNILKLIKYRHMPSRIARLLKLKSSLLVGILVTLFAAATQLYSFSLGNAIRYPDEAEYLRLAQNLADSGRYTLDGSTPTAYRPPAYPLLLAAGIKLGLPIVALRALNAASLLACMGLLYLLLRRRHPAQAGIAVVLIITYPVLAYTAATFYPQIPAATLLLSALVVLFPGWLPGFRRCLIAGLLLGLSLLMVPTFGFALAFTSIFIATHPFQRKTALRAGLILCGAGIVMAPWVVRNAVVFHRFIPLSTNSGINLLLGNSENTTPNSGTTADISHYAESVRGLSEVGANDYYTQAATTYMKDNPSRATKLYTAKVLNYFNYKNRLQTQSEQSPLRDRLMLMSYGLLLGLSMLRIGMIWKHPLPLIEKYITWLYLLNAPVAAIYFTRIRFRLPLDILLVALAASALVIIADYFRCLDRNTNHRNRGIPIT